MGSISDHRGPRRGISVGGIQGIYYCLFWVSVFDCIRIFPEIQVMSTNFLLQGNVFI